MAKKPELLPGTLDLLILQTLRRAPLHGYGIAIGRVLEGA
jgi:PadR family transcriptional regulator PadR